MGQALANGMWAEVPMPGLQSPLHISAFRLGPLPSPLEDMTWLLPLELDPACHLV